MINTHFLFIIFSQSRFFCSKVFLTNIQISCNSIYINTNTDQTAKSDFIFTEVGKTDFQSNSEMIMYLIKIHSRSDSSGIILVQNAT